MLNFYYLYCLLDREQFISLILALLYQASKEEKVNDEKAIKNKSIEEKLDKELEEIILELASSSELNQTNEVENQYIKKELDNLKNTLNENIEKTLERRGINYNNIVIDIEEYKKSRINKSKDTGMRN